MRHSKLLLLFLCVLAVVLVSCSDDDIPTQPDGPFLVTGVSVGKTISPVAATVLTGNQNHNFIWSVAYTLNQTDKALLSIQTQREKARQIEEWAQKNTAEQFTQTGFELLGTFWVYDTTVQVVNGQLVGGNPTLIDTSARVPQESGVENFNVTLLVPRNHPQGGTVLVLELLVDFFDFNQGAFRGVPESVLWLVQ